LAKWGARVEFLERIEERTGETPQALIDRPRVFTENQEFIEAFFTLNAARIEKNPIPVSEIKAYMELFGADDPAKMIRRIQIMDRAFLEISMDNRSKK